MFKLLTSLYAHYSILYKIVWIFFLSFRFLLLPLLCSPCQGMWQSTKSLEDIREFCDVGNRESLQLYLQLYLFFTLQVFFYWSPIYNSLGELDYVVCSSTSPSPSALLLSFRLQTWSQLLSERTVRVVSLLLRQLDWYSFLSVCFQDLRRKEVEEGRSVASLHSSYYT